MSCTHSLALGTNLYFIYSLWVRFRVTKRKRMPTLLHICCCRLVPQSVCHRSSLQFRFKIIHLGNKIIRDMRLYHRKCYMIGKICWHEKGSRSSIEEGTCKEYRKFKYINYLQQTMSAHSAHQVCSCAASAVSAFDDQNM